MLVGILCIGVTKCIAQTIDLASEFKQFDISKLPVYLGGTTEHEETTYDRKWGNDDGFVGTYSFVTRKADSSLVMLDVDGPGVLNRIATPTPTKDTLDFYIDHATKPSLSICYYDLFSGKVYPFIAPLCDTAVGGYFCYFPVLFQKHLKIVCRGHHLQFHQLGYRLFAKGTTVRSFKLPFSKAEQEALATLKSNWSQPTIKGNQSTISAELYPGREKTVYEIKTSGRINAISFDTSGTKNLRLLITWDNESYPAVNCPLRDFFGYAFGQPAMQGLLCGTKEGKHYTLIPMPFDKGAKIELINEGTDRVDIHGCVTFRPEARQTQTEGKFYAVWKQERLTEWDPFHVFLDIKGKGHYVGTILKAQGYFNRGTIFFEGDDTTAVNGKFTMHGTGSEDYFNGGWYDVKGRWDHAESRLLSGCLGYGTSPAHTGGYRFFMGDKLSFETSFYHAIEHGGDRRGIPAEYTSVSYYYCDRDKTKQQTN